MMGKTKAKRKTGLGRGLEGLLGVENTASKPDKIELKSPQKESNPEGTIYKVAIENLEPNKEQPRSVFNKEALNDLAKSIKEQGIMQPIVAQKTKADHYEIIAGERRWRAAQLCGLKEVPVILKEVSAQNKLELAIIENIQRDDLNPIEEGEAYQLLANKYSLTQKEIAQKVGKDRATVANLMRVTALAPKVKDQVSQGKITLGHAKVLLGVEDKQMQISLAEKAERLHLSVRATESMVKNALNPDKEKNTSKYNDEYKSVEDQLKRRFGTKVKVSEKNGRGKLELAFHSLEQFNELIEKMMG